MEISASKRREYNRSSYPDIPLSDQDPGHPEDGSNPFAIRLVRAFDPKDISKGDRFRAESITSMDETNERLVRSCHPSLSSKPDVWVSESIFGEPVWLVDSPLRESESVFAGGRPIHYYPNDYREYIPRGILSPRTHNYDLQFRHFINPRRFLRPNDLDSLRELFPDATGVEILVAGFMVIIFDDIRSVRNAYNNIWPLVLAGLRVYFDVARYDLTTSGIEYGLKVQLQGGLTAVTPVTHGFMHLPAVLKRNSAKGLVQHMLKKITEPLQRYLPSGVREDTTFIIPSGVLSLTSPPGYPPITEWGEYSPVLDGKVEVFCVCQSLIGEIDSTLFERATVLGSGWRWDRSQKRQDSFLLWHTAGEYAPGTPLCLGSPSDSAAKAVLFQNFQTLFHLEGEPRKKRENLIKGGFLLPTEIRNSTIMSVPGQDHTPSEKSDFDRGRS